MKNFANIQSYNARTGQLYASNKQNDHHQRSPSEQGIVRIDEFVDDQPNGQKKRKQAEQNTDLRHNDQRGLSEKLVMPTTAKRNIFCSVYLVSPA